MACKSGSTTISQPNFFIPSTFSWVSRIVLMFRFSMQTELNYLGQLHHGNLVKLIGYCVESDNRLLVYEFMPKGSLENHLFRSRVLLLAMMLMFVYGYYPKSIDLFCLACCIVILYYKSPPSQWNVGVPKRNHTTQVIIFEGCFLFLLFKCFLFQLLCCTANSRSC